MRKTFMKGANAYAVGSAIVSTIYAATKQPQSESIETWVQFCLKAAEEAFAAVHENPPRVMVAGHQQNDPLMLMLLKTGDAFSRDDNRQYGASITHNAEAYAAQTQPQSRPMDGDDLEKAAKDAASMAFRCCMPQLTGRRRAQAYFACVAAGLQHGYFHGAEAKAMLHSAQLALNAYPKRQQKPRQSRRNEESAA